MSGFLNGVCTFWMLIVTFGHLGYENAVSGEVDGQCTPLQNSTLKPYNRLVTDLFCDYDTTITSERRVIPITISYFLDYFVVDETLRTVKLFGSANMSWIDPNLKWQRMNYNGIEYIQGTMFNIWLPDILSYEEGLTNYFEDVDTFVDRNIKISYSGKVEFNSRMILNGHCKTRVQNWPFDKMNCSVIAGISQGEGLKIKLKYKNNSINLAKFSFQDRNWKLMDISNSTWKTKNCYGARCPILYDLKLKRKSTVYQATVIFPQICISALCLFSFWISDGVIYRLALYVIILMSEILYLIWLSTILAVAEAQESVRLFNFFGGISWITTIGIFQAVIKAHMLSDQNKSHPPILIVNTLNKLYNNKYTQMLSNVYMKDNDVIIEQEETGESETDDQWKLLSATMDLFLFIITSFYIIFHFSLISWNYWF